MIEQKGLYIHQDQPYTGSFEAGTRGSSLLEVRRQLVINRDTLYASNSSDLAHEGLDLFRGSRAAGKLRVKKKCGDARSITDDPEDTIVIPSIAATGPNEPFAKLFGDPRVLNIGVVAHFNGRAFVLGENPPGCGGRGRKQEHINSNGQIFEEDIDEYVNIHIPHSDVVLNALREAEEIAGMCYIPTIAYAQDHRSARLYPLAYFRQTFSGAMESMSAVPLRFLHDRNYKPKEIYKNGIPQLGIDDIGDDFQDFKDQLLRNQQNVARLHRVYYDYEAAQEIQDPKALIISDSVKPVPLRYPGLFDVPGSFFEIRLGRERVDDATTIINTQSQTAAINQAHYSISHCVQNHGEEGKDFASLNTVLVETRDYDLSKGVARELLAKPWMKDWIQIPGHTIYAAEVISGEIIQLDDFGKAA